ncbi:hypothetical protein ACFSQW_19675 [Sphingobacterium tabacisoli]|uniref:Uncharacterized protein n=1 Tax=Sphingobacterium tabacisoli TaxID=2044855 RepID=A0ABW5L6E6_9SPHI
MKNEDPLFTIVLFSFDRQLTGGRCDTMERTMERATLYSSSMKLIAQLYNQVASTQLSRRKIYFNRSG